MRPGLEKSFCFFFFRKRRLNNVESVISHSSAAPTSRPTEVEARHIMMPELPGISFELAE
jgi:hypothetical protein